MTRLLHLSDTHVPAPGARTQHPEIDARTRLAEVLERCRAYGPFDAVVVTGDVCDDASPEGAGAVRDVLEGLAPVVLAVPGNHDHAGPVREAFGAPVAEVGPWHVVGADTHVEGEVAGVADGALEALAEIGGRPSVLLMHHPLESRSTHEWFTLGGGERLAAALETHPAPLVVLSGHTHEAYESRRGRAHLIGAPSTWYAIRHRGDEFDLVLAEYGATVVTLDDATFEAAAEPVTFTDDGMLTEHRIDLRDDTGV